jgi:hypothetical protein
MSNSKQITPLFSAAQAVMIAYWKGEEASQQLGVAAALRAAALHIDDASDGLECQDILRQIAAELDPPSS